MGKETTDEFTTQTPTFTAADRSQATSADAMQSAGKEKASVLQALAVSEATFDRWRRQYGSMKSEEGKRLKQLEEENKQLKVLVAELTLDNRILKHISEGNIGVSPSRIGVSSN